MQLAARSSVPHCSSLTVYSPNGRGMVFTNGAASEPVPEAPDSETRSMNTAVPAAL